MAASPLGVSSAVLLLSSTVSSAVLLYYSETAALRGNRPATDMALLPFVVVSSWLLARMRFLSI